MEINIIKSIKESMYKYFLNPLIVLFLAVVTIFFLIYHFTIWLIKGDKKATLHIKVSN